MTDDRRRAGSANRPGDGPIPTFDLYALLGIRPDATHQEVREAVASMDRRLQTAAARQRGGATARQKRFHVARHWLLDADRRRRYDAEVARRAAGGASAVRGSGVRGGSASRGSAGKPWYREPAAWLGAAAVAIVVAFLAFRPGGFLNGSGTGSSVTGSPGFGSEAPSTGPSAQASGGVAHGTDCPTQQPAAGAAGTSELVTIETPKGKMEITVVNDLSPIAAGNFVALASCGYYDGVVFHRVASLPDGTPFVIQGGDPTGTGTGGPGYTIQDEPVTTAYKRGTVAMARTSAANSAGSQFFIVLDDKDAEVLSSANTYQIFGSVTSGMDTADAIYAAAGGVENPTDPIPMTKVTVGPAPAASSGASSPAASPSAAAPSASQ